MYETTVKTAEDVLGFDYCSALVPADGAFEVVASAHLESGKRIEVDGGVITQTYEENEGILTPDIEESEIAKPFDSEYRSGVSVPIGDHAVLQAISKTPHYYSEVDLELAELLALHAEAALSQVRSQELIREQKRKIEKLHTVATDLTACHSHDELYRLMRSASEEILGLDWCTMYVMEEGRFVAAMASESSPIAVGEHPFSGEGESKAREIYETGESVVVEDLHEVEVGQPTTDRIRSVLQVPVGDIGVYNAAHEEPGMFDESDLELAELLASSVAEAHDRIEAQEQLRSQKQKLERQNERLDQFASMVTHDLRNPLNTAKIHADFIDGVDGEHYQKLTDALDRMEDMIDEMLTLAKAGTIVESTETVTLQELATAAWNTTDTEGASLEAPSGWGQTIEADPERLRHVFENLFRNAAEHNEPPVTVRIGSIDNPSGFYVEDDASGIQAADREMIFEHGYTTAGGTGLGLAIVEQIVDGHGWELSVTSSDSGGARFEIHTE